MILFVAENYYRETLDAICDEDLELNETSSVYKLDFYNHSTKGKDNYEYTENLKKIKQLENEYIRD
jgi:hypothetical protein